MVTSTNRRDTRPVSRPGTAAVEIAGLRKAYGSRIALDGVDLDVPVGQVLCILGHNGAGKTTLVETVTGLRRPDAGTLRVLGLDPVRQPDLVRQRVGVQLQTSALPPRMKVQEAMAVFAAAYDRPADTNALLADWGLTAARNQFFGRISGGQRQRLFIALALVGRPEVVVLDELTTGLDPQARRDTWCLVDRLRDDGVTVLLVTHAMDEAETLCDRLVVLRGGRLVAEGTPEQVRGGHRSLEAAYLALSTGPGTAGTDVPARGRRERSMKR